VRQPYLEVLLERQVDGIIIASTGRIPSHRPVPASHETTRRGRSPPDRAGSADDSRLESLVRYIVAQAIPHLVEQARPLKADTFALRVVGTKGVALGVFGTDRTVRLGQPLPMKLAPGRYRDIWNGGSSMSRASANQ